MKALVTQLCPTLCDPMDCSPPGSSVESPWNSPGKNTGMGSHFLPRGSSWPRDWTQVSRMQADLLLTEPPGKPCLSSVPQVSLLQQPWNPISAFLAQQVYLCNGILLSHKKERNPDIYNNMNVSRDYHTNWSKSKTNVNIIWYHFYEESKKMNLNYLQNRSRFVGTEKKFMVTKEEGGKLGVLD